MEWIGIDIGGSHITTVVCSGNFTIQSKATVSVGLRDVDSVMEAIEKTALQFTKIYAVHGIGVAVPGNVDPVLNTARYLPNFNWDYNIALGPLLIEKLQVSQSCSITMRNDGRCAAIAESKFGVGKNSKVFAFLTLGTGIGGALLINGVLFDGCSFDAGDFGHHVIRSGGSDGDKRAFSCNCGKQGCFETQASAEGLVKHYRYQLTENKRQTSQSLEEPLNAEKIINAMRQGDDVAKHAFNHFKYDLATGLANLVTFYNPDTVALGGGLSQAPEVFEGLQQLVDERTLPATRGRVQIVPSVVGVEAGALGAAVLAAEATSSAS